MWHDDCCQCMFDMDLLRVCKAEIPRPGLPGNKKGQVKCVCGIGKPGAWQRFRCVYRKNVLEMYPVHTVITFSNTGKIKREDFPEIKDLKKVEPEIRLNLTDTALVPHDERTFAKQSCFQIAAPKTNIYL